MLVEYKKPWLLELLKEDKPEYKNPFVSDSTTLTIEFKVEKLHEDSDKIGFIGMPGMNFGISYDYDVDTFVFEYWTKNKDGKCKFHCHKDFHINQNDIENGLIITIQYDKEKMNFTLYHNFIPFFDIDLDDPLIDEYNNQALYFGAHNPDTEQVRHRCFTEMEMKHFSIFDGIVDIDEVEKFYSNKNNRTDNLICYFDFKEKYLVHNKNKSYNLIQHQKIKLVKIIMDDLNISLSDRIRLKKNKLPGLKIDYKQPYYLNTQNDTNLLMNRSFTLNTTFKVEREFKQDQKIGFVGIPGKNFGISYDYEVDSFVFEFWTQKSEEEFEFHCYKNYKINVNDLHNGITISIVYKKNSYFELYHNYNLIDKIEVVDDLLIDYAFQPLYFGCHHPSSLLETHRCFTEIEFTHFSIYDGVMNIIDLEKQLKSENCLTYFNFKKNDKSDNIKDSLNKETSLKIVDLNDYKKMTDYSITKDKLDSVGCGFCLAKWTQVTMHLHNGTTHSCHHPEPHKVALEEIQRNPTALHNSKHKKQARKEMLEGKRPSECNYCWNVEDNSDSFSDRVFKSSEPWSEPHFDEIKGSNWRDDFNPKYVEVNFSNTCNFKCAYCGPEYSTKWMEEVKEFGAYNLSYEFNGIKRMEDRNTLPYKQTEENPYVEAFWEWFPELYESMDTFRITGGEPLLSKDTWKVLDFIIDSETPNRNLKLSINSNLGVTDELVDRLIVKLDKICSEERVKEIIIFTSCDAYGNQAEYVRHGLEFDRLFNNIGKILTVLPKVTVVIMSTFNIFSIFSYEQLVKKVYELKVKHFNPERYWNSALILDTSYLRYPDFLGYKLLKGYIGEEYFTRIEKFMKFNSTYRSLNSYQAEVPEDVGFSIKEIEKISRIKDIFVADKESDRDYEQQKKDFVNFIKQYEYRRGMRCEDYYPELISFIKKIKHDHKL
jgi:MoaA/NifB/PqqE/SkfB family radical SAM enzyme